MGATTGISWANHTFNGVIGCTKVSPACTHCYAEQETPVRVNRQIGLELWGPKAARRSASEAMWRDLYRWNDQARKAQKRSLVFCYSMGDVFENFEQQLVNHEGKPLFMTGGINRFEISGQYKVHAGDVRARLFRAVKDCEWLIFLLLTKRPESIKIMVPSDWMSNWPRNAWIGTTTENQEYANRRIYHLLEIPARVRFLSVEPMLGPVNLHTSINAAAGSIAGREFNEYIQWVIVGGESRRDKHEDARMMRCAWADYLRRQSDRMKIPYFFKQWGDWAPFINTPDGIELDTYPMKSLDDGHSYHCLGKKLAGDMIGGKQYHNFPQERYLKPGIDF